MDYSDSIAPSQVVTLNPLACLPFGTGSGGGSGVCFCCLVGSGAVDKWKNFVSLVVSIAYLSNIELA